MGKYRTKESLNCIREPILLFPEKEAKSVGSASQKKPICQSLAELTLLVLFWKRTKLQTTLRPF
jgi:hypothetical protein